jgi:hypothetical protein
MAAYTPKVRVQKPAPHFSGTAVVDGTFEGTLLHFPHGYLLQHQLTLPSYHTIHLTNPATLQSSA